MRDPRCHVRPSVRQASGSGQRSPPRGPRPPARSSANRRRRPGFSALVTLLASFRLGHWLTSVGGDLTARGRPGRRRQGGWPQCLLLLRPRPPHGPAPAVTQTHRGPLPLLVLPPLPRVAAGGSVVPGSGLLSPAVNSPHGPPWVRRGAPVSPRRPEAQVPSPSARCLPTPLEAAVPRRLEMRAHPSSQGSSDPHIPPRPRAPRPGPDGP